MLVVGVAVRIVEAHEIRLGRIFPTILELLSLSTTALREAGIAYLVAIGQNLSSGGADGFYHMGIIRLSDTLIALTMIIGTHIEDGVILTVVPADDLIIFLDKREETVAAVLSLLALLHLSQEPRTGDDGMSLEEL